LWWLYSGVVLALWLVIAVVVFATPREPDRLQQQPYPTPVLMPSPTPLQTARHLVAAQTIPAGTIIASQMMVQQTVPLAHVVPGAYVILDDVVGKVAAVDIQREQVITAHLLEDPAPAPDIRATATERALLAPPTSAPANPNIVLSTPTPVRYTQVVVPVYALPAGTTITAADVTLTAYPVQMAPFTAISNLDQVVGKVAASDLPANYPVLVTTLLSADNPTAPTPFPPPTGACVVTAGGAEDVPLYDSPETMLRAGTLRPNTDAVAVGEGNGRYEIELPSGLPLGWIEAAQVTTSGDCAGL
jgi:flagella basal body P-ring formation protein FlgA